MSESEFFPLRRRDVAKALLAEAGHPDGIEEEIVIKPTSWVMVMPPVASPRRFRQLEWARKRFLFPSMGCCEKIFI